MVLGEQATTDKTIRRFRDIPATLAELNSAGLHAQTVNELLTMCVGAVSQHVLRMSFLLDDEAKRFETEVVGFWSLLIQRDAASPLFHMPPKLGGLGVGSAEQRHAAAPCLAWQTVLPALMTFTEPPDADTPFASTPKLRAKLFQLQTTLSRQMNAPAFFLKPLGLAIRTKNHPKDARQIHSITTTKTTC